MLVKRYDAHLIQISTDFIFDGEDGPYKEEDEPNPLSYYGLVQIKIGTFITSS